MTMPPRFNKSSAMRSCGILPQAVPMASRHLSRGMARTIAWSVLAPIVCAAAPEQSHLGPVTDILVTGDKVYSSSQAGVFAGTGESLTLQINPGFRVTSLAFLRQPDDARNLLVFAGGVPGVKGSLGWIGPQLREDQLPAVSDLADDLLYDVAASPDGNLLAVAGADGAIRLSTPADLARGEGKIRHRHTAFARAVAFSPDGKWLASAGADGVVIISPLDGSDPARQILDHTAGVECLAWSPDSQSIASGAKDSKVRLHEVSGKLIRTYTGLGMESEPVAGRVPSRVLSLAWKQNVLVAGTSKGTLYRLSLSDDTSTRLARPGQDPIYALAFAPDGLLLVGGQGRLEKVPVDR